MRIWAFPSFYPFDRPGMQWAGIFAHRQYKGLIENGAELQVIVPVPWHPPYPLSNLHPQWKAIQQLDYPLKRVYDGITVHHPRIANIRPARLMRKSFKERYLDAVKSVFESEHITVSENTDIFYSQWLPESVSVQYAAHQLGIKSAILCIGDDVVLWPKANKTNYAAFEDLVTHADKRFVCAGYLAEEANRILGKTLSYETTYMGVDYDFFKPVSPERKAALRKKLELPEDSIVILCVGQAKLRKGWLDLFAALKEVKEVTQNFVLIAVYAGDEDLELFSDAYGFGLDDHFIDMGEVKPSLLNEVFNAADIFCLASHSEGMANVNIEAMSSGLPVITTRVGGHSELIRTNETGILVPPQQPQILYEALLKLINDKELREKLGRNAREFIVNEWGNPADNARQLYKKLTSE